MNKTVKNLVIVFTLICSILLVVFCIELFLLNRNAGDGVGTGQAASDSSPTESGTSGTDAETADTGLSDGTEPSGDQDQSTNSNQPTEAREPPEGTLQKLLMHQNLELTFYADEDYFEHSLLPDGHLYTYDDGGNATLEIGFAFLPPHGVEAYAMTFLDNYLDGGESTVVGEGPIRASTLRGIYVTGSKNGETYEGWVQGLSEIGINDLILVLVINYSNDEQRDALHSWLDTMEMVPIGEEEDNQQTPED